MPSTDTLQVRNCIYIIVVLYFHLGLIPRSVSSKIVGLKLIKLNF